MLAQRSLSSDRLADLLSQQLGRTVQIKGQAEIEFWNGPRLKVGELQVSNPPHSPFRHLAELESVTVGVRWWNLPALFLGLARHALRIEVQGGRIHVDARADVLGADGVWPSADDPFTGLTLWLDQIAFQGVKLKVETEAGGLEAVSIHRALVIFETGRDQAVVIEARQMDVRIEGIGVQGKLRLDAPLVEVDAPKPANLSGLLAVHEVDLAALGDKRFGSAGAKLSEVRIPIHFCESWDVDLSLSVASVKLRTGRAENADLRMSSSQGRWKIELREIDLPVGLGRGAASLACNELPADLKLQASVTSKGQRASDLHDPSLDVSGEMVARFGVAGRGENWQRIVADLKGGFSVFLGPVQSSRLYDDIYSRSLYHALTISWGQSNEAIVDCGILDVQVDQGVGEIRQMLVATPDLVIGGHGQIDLKSGVLDIVLKPEAKHPDLVSFHIPVLIHGAIRDPSVGPAWGSLLPGLGKQAVKSLLGGLVDEGFWEGLRPGHKKACLRAVGMPKR